MSTASVFLKVNRIDASTRDRALGVTVADVHESTGRLGFQGLMDPAMKRVTTRRKIAGPAITASCPAGDNLMMHRALRLAEPGDVLVVVCEGETSAAQWGDVATRYAIRIGLAGVVIQGCARDRDTVDALDFPVWATHVWPIHAEKARGGAVNVPLVCAGVRVSPGDLVVADGDGVIVVPRQEATRVVDDAVAKMNREEEIIAAIQAGSTVWDLSGAAKAYAALGIVEQIARTMTSRE